MPHTSASFLFLLKLNIKGHSYFSPNVSKIHRNNTDMTVTEDNIVSIENHKSFSHERVSILIVNFVNVAYIICTFVFDFSIYVLCFIFFI